MSYVKFSNQNAGESSIDLGAGNDTSTSGDKERILSKDATTKRKFPVLIATIAILILVIILGVSIFSIHLTSDQTKFANFQIYVFGGRDENFTQHSFVSHFNSSTGEWGEINEAPDEVTFPGLCGAVVDKKIYLFGGRHGSSVFNTTIVYDSSTNNFTFLQPMPVPRESCGAAVLNGYVYVAGGWNGTQHVSSIMSGTSSVVRYNLRTGKWSNVSSMNTPRSYFELVELKGRLYAIGGDRTVEAYDPTTNRWSFIASMGNARKRNDPGVAVYEGKIYVIRRSDDGKDELFEEYSPETDQWKNLVLPKSYHLKTLLTANEKLWAFAGRYRESSKAVFTYDPFPGKWTRQRDMNVVRWSHAAFVTNH